MSPDVVVVSLLVFMIAQDIFWAIICIRLTNRIMSRNYAEVVQADLLKKPAPVKPSEDALTDPESERQANELNRLFGVI